MEQGKKKYFIERLERLLRTLERMRDEMRADLEVKGIFKPKAKEEKKEDNGKQRPVRSSVDKAKRTSK